MSRDAAPFFGFILAAVSELPEKEKNPPMPPGGMGGMDY
jgi:hypothetical protein